MKAYQITVKIYFCEVAGPYGFDGSDAQERPKHFWKETTVVLPMEEAEQKIFFFPREEEALKLKGEERKALVVQESCIKLYLFKDEQGVYLHSRSKWDNYGENERVYAFLPETTNWVHAYTYEGSTMGERYGEEEYLYEIIFEEIDE